MLRIIPESAAQFAIDGIIPASAVQGAGDSKELVLRAKRRARMIVDDAAHQADQLIDSSVTQGYVDAYITTMTALVPSLQKLLVDVDVLRRQLLEDMVERLERALSEDEVQEALIARCVERLHQGSDEVTALLIPEGQAQLFAALAGTFEGAGFDVRLAAIEVPVLECRHRIVELNVVGALAPAVAGALDYKRLAEYADSAGSAFLERVHRNLSRAKVRSGLELI